MLPDLRPVHRRVPTFHDDGAERDALAVLENALAKLVIVGQTIGEGFEAADFPKVFPAQQNRRAEGKVERLQGLRLQDLAPKIGVDGDGFPLHRGRGWIGKAVKAIHQADFFVAQRGDKIGEKIRRHAHVGVAYQNQIMSGARFKLGEFGNFGVCTERLAAEDELRVGVRIFLKKVFDDFADEIAGVGDAEEDLGLAGVILVEPALERFGGGGVAAFERFEDGNGGREICFGNPLVQREFLRGEKLPEQQREA
jgi:hypothetical protein